MAPRRRRRGSGGHPAKVARQRDRDRQRRSHESDPDRSFAAELCQAAAEIGSALEAELFVAQILGAIWSHRDELDLATEPEEAEIAHGGRLVTALAERREPVARAVVATIGTVSSTALGSLAFELDEKLEDEGIGIPKWSSDLGRGRVVRSIVVRETVFDDAGTVWLESEFPDEQRLAVGVAIDHNLGSTAYDVLLADSIDLVAELFAEHSDPQAAEEMRIEELDPADGAGLVLEAIEMTDHYLDPPVKEEYADHRALALQWSTGIEGGPRRPPEPTPIGEEERTRLLESFLHSPEAATASIAADDLAAEIVRLAIDFGSDYTNGDPLRWSPTVVELFMTDWFPRKVVEAAELETAVPAALEAWIRYAGSRREIPQKATDTTVKSIGRWVDEMRNAIQEGAANPATQLIRAAKEAGVAIDDKEALEQFMEDWNADR